VASEAAKDGAVPPALDAKRKPRGPPPGGQVRDRKALPEHGLRNKAGELTPRSSISTQQRASMLIATATWRSQRYLTANQNESSCVSTYTGDGRLKPEFRARATTICVRQIGNTDDNWAWLQRSRKAYQPSRPEGDGVPLGKEVR
jgi:hypothetical protein